MAPRFKPYRKEASERASLRSEDKNRPSKAAQRPRVVLTLAAVGKWIGGGC